MFSSCPLFKLEGDIFHQSFLLFSSSLFFIIFHIFILTSVFFSKNFSKSALDIFQKSAEGLTHTIEAMAGCL